MFSITIKKPFNLFHLSIFFLKMKQIFAAAIETESQSASTFKLNEPNFSIFYLFFLLSIFFYLFDKRGICFSRWSLLSIFETRKKILRVFPASAFSSIPGVNPIKAILS